MTWGGRIGATRGDFLRLFDGASAAGLGDGDLLARFVSRRDEAAFEALVGRLGPMVLGVCRRMLAEPSDVEDAFQATFLVLVRRAGSIRDREVVATWLYEVAVRVARRARLDASKRSEREKRGAVVEAREDDSAPGVEWSEVRARIDEEIGRLPESHRRLVVLCDVEGLSREEAAARLGWTANMVRGRLERARGRLRDRLTRRGLSPSGAWLALATPATPPRAALVTATIRGASSLMIGRAMGVSSAMVLSEGVARMMMLAKWKLAATALISAGAMVAGSGMLAAQQGPGNAPAAAKPPAAQPPVTPVATAPAAALPGAEDPGGHQIKLPSPAESQAVANTLIPRAEFRAAADALKPRSIAELNRARVEEAKARYDTQAAFYAEGRITIDRVVNASRAWMEAERDAADAKAGRFAAIRSHYARISEMLNREQSELEVGRATTADVAEPRAALLEAELTLAREIEAPDVQPIVSVPSVAVVRREPLAQDKVPVRGDPMAKPGATEKLGRLKVLAGTRVEIAREVLAESRTLFINARTPLESVIAASKSVMEAERDAADSAEGRKAAVRDQIKFLTDLIPIVEAMADQARVARSYVKVARLAVLEAEVLEAREDEASAPPGSPGVNADGPGAALPGPGAIPTPAGNLPTTAPARGPRVDAASTPLAEAVAAFNAHAKGPEVGWSEPPLTEDEVITAIRLWQPNREAFTFAKGVRTNVTQAGAPVAAFKAIAESRTLPQGASFEVKKSVDVGDDHLYAGWWVNLVVPAWTHGPEGSQGPLHPFPIRGRLVRLVPLEEVLAQEKAGRRVHAGLILPESMPLAERIKNLEDRIAWRDGKAGK